MGLFLLYLKNNKNKNKMTTKKETKKMYFEFDVIKWNETGNKILEKHKMTVQRQSLSSARTVVRKKYPVSKGYFEELNDTYTK